MPQTRISVAFSERIKQKMVLARVSAAITAMDGSLPQLPVFLRWGLKDSMAYSCGYGWGF